MTDKTKKIVGISPEYKEALAKLASREEFPRFIKFLNIQKNNTVIIEWFRLKSTDPNLGNRKAYYEGQVDMIDFLIRTFEEVKKGDKDGTE